MKSEKIEEITIQFVKADIGDYLISKGFFPIKRNHYEDLDGRNTIKVEDGISCYSEERGSVYSDPLLIMQIPFIPETPILDYLLKGIHFIK